MQALNELANELNALLKTSVVTSTDHDQSTAVHAVLTTMVRHMDGVPELEMAVNDLKTRLHDGSSQEALDTLLENLATAVSCVIKSIGEDKRELESFLEQVTQQLAQFEDWARGNESETLARRKDTASLERNVEQEVGGLQSDMEASTEMSDLKGRVQKRLDSIADQLTRFRTNEEQRAEAAVKRNAALLDEINRLKVRTHELAVRCTDQEERLMHDALTGAHTRSPTIGACRKSFSAGSVTACR